MATSSLVLQFRPVYLVEQAGFEVIKTFIMLNSTEHKISTAHKHKNADE